MSPTAASPTGAVTRMGNSYSGTNVTGDITVNGQAPGGSTVFANGAPNAPGARMGGTPLNPGDQPPGLAVINNGGADRNAAFNEGAALRTAAARGSWSPRGGYQGDDAAVRAAAIPIANRARMGEAQLNANTTLATTAAREAGDTARLGMREAGDDARAARAVTVDQQRLGLAAQEFGLRREGANLDNASKARIDAAQKAVVDAKTPAEQRTASERLAALTGKANADNFSAVTIGGGSTVDPTTGVAVPNPQSAVLYNRATGETRPMTGGAAAPAARPAVAEGTISEIDGKRARFTGGKWVPING